jgi:hydrogenase maturation protein HypF
MTASYLDGVAAPAVRARNAARWDAVVQLARSGVNSPLTSSAGRLFDAVAALAGVRDEISYEGQAAIELEQLADVREPGTYVVPITDGVADGDPVFEVRGDDLVRTVADELSRGTEPRIAAMRFHRALAGAVAAGAHRIREATGLTVVALSGGVFQNVLLLDLATDLLEARGFRVLTHHRVPTNDGGISLGQAAVAAAADAD